MLTTAPTRLELNNSDPGESVVIMQTLTLPIAAHAAASAASSVVVQVVPPTGPDGFLPSRDGRRQRVPDIRALADRMNRQGTAARVDTDHRSEPASTTFAGETAAGGWLSNYRVNSSGGIEASMELGEGLRARVRRKEYRYVSPAYLISSDGVILGLSSLALVNNPNLPLDAPTLHSLQHREARLAEREAAADRRDTELARNAVGSAILNNAIEPHQRDYFVNNITSHRDGIEGGIDAFEMFLNTGGTAGAMTPAPPITMPFGCEVRSERVTLHNRISGHARTHGISYRDAIARGAGGGVSTGPIPVGVDLNAKAAYEQLASEIEQAVGEIHMIPGEGLLSRAKKCIEIARAFASAGRWRPAVAAISQAGEYVRANDGLMAGRPRRADRMLGGAEPTPDMFLVGVERMA